MAIQTSLGKAFEFACLNALQIQLNQDQHVMLENLTMYNIVKYYYTSIINEETKCKLDLAANAAVRVILRLEPQLLNPLTNTPLILSIQEDIAGIRGDVRDVVCIRRQNEWEIGLSCKHNHSAVKHSRLSNTIDFGQQWLGTPCSLQYFQDISPLFKELRQMRTSKTLWRDIDRKAERFYIPLLQSFVDELLRLDSSLPSGQVPERLLHYLLGRNDFYKVITHDSREVTEILAFNIYGTLNKPSGNVKPQTRVHQLDMPSRIIEISFKPNSDNTIIITCDHGWQISLRIHSASTIVEPSLKFDVTLIGTPQTLYSHHEPWR